MLSVLVGAGIALVGDQTIVISGNGIVHYGMNPAFVNLAVAAMSLAAVILLIWKKRWQRSVKFTTLLIAFAAVALVGSLLVRDDYCGGTCGEMDLPAGHLHAGYPYSWLDGSLCIPRDAQLQEYANQHLLEAGWCPDLPALMVDGLFWMNIGIVIRFFLEIALSLRVRWR